ncbi:MAG: hypothetical protein KH111_13230, partial [Bacteroidales bacterium]|nr:hypothetical protein [Bacteroidales bacterium]
RWNNRTHRVVKVVSRTSETVHINHLFSQKERFAMVIAYFEKHEYLTIKEYAKMTRLTKAAAEAELDAFAMDKNKPVKVVIRGKKKVYVKNN